MKTYIRYENKKIWFDGIPNGAYALEGIRDPEDKGLLMLQRPAGLFGLKDESDNPIRLTEKAGLTLTINGWEKQ